MPPLALQRERMREEKNETPGKKEMRKEIKRAVTEMVVVDGRETEDEI